MTAASTRRLPAITDDELRALPPLVEVDTVARALRCSTSMVYAMAREGTFPFEVLTFGRARRWRRNDLLEYLGLDPIRTAA